MKSFVSTVAVLAVFSATAAYAAAPDTALKAAKACCSVLAACCGLPCCG